MNNAELKSNLQQRDRDVQSLQEQVAQRDAALGELKQKVVDGMESELDARRRLEAARDAIANLSQQVQTLQQKLGPRAVRELKPGEGSTDDADNNSKGSRAGQKEGGS